MTTALVGMVASGAALAETKITGNMTLAYKAVSEQTVATSKDGYGRETQINVANSGDLNNGLKYAAGFSIEADGNETLAGGATGENVYFDVISGNTTVSFGQDHGPKTSQSATPRVAEMANTTFGANSSTNGVLVNPVSYDYNAGANIDGAFMIHLIQKTTAGTVSFGYQPSQGDSGGADQEPGVANANSAMNIIFKGNAGVDGLSIVAAYQKEEAATTALQDGKVKQIGVGYNFGKFAAGVTRNMIDESTIGNETTSMEYGATVALSDNLSAGILYVVTEGKDAGVSWREDEKLTIGQLAYNMGPATISFSYGTAEGTGGSVSSKDVDVGTVRLSTAF